MSDDLQLIPARHGVATFVPAGQTIKIINTSGTQVVDTWAFALPTPEEKKVEKKEEKKDEKKEDKKEEKKEELKTEEKKTPAKPKKKKDDLPSQEEAEKATQEGLKGVDGAKEDGTPQKSTWGSYVPSLGFSGGKGKTETPKKEETEQQKNSKTWSSYFPSGQGFSSYLPSSTSTTVSSFAKEHQRDTKKSYLEQLQDFSKTPVGAVGMKGMAAATGSGYGGALYAGYSAYNAAHVPEEPPMEFMSMPHSRAATLHMVPRVNDTLVSNLREPMLTIVEDTSPGVHDTLIAACDPQRYHGLGVEEWEKHGSCAENLVLALKELNERAGLKGGKAVGADVTINVVPAPFNLFMNIPWDNGGNIDFKGPKTKKGDYVRFKAERDVVVVMSACPQDVLDINAKNPTDAHFLVEESNEDTAEALQKTQPKKRPAPKKLSSSRATSVAPSQAGGDDDAKNGAAPAKKPVPQRRPAPPAKKPSEAPSQPAAKKPAEEAKAAPAKKPAAKPAAAPAKKPTPKAAAPKAAAPAKKPAAAEGKENGTATPPAEKKKPRKLTPKPKPAAE